MKTTMTTLLLLLTLAACSKQKTSKATFEVSRAFAFANTSFGGGLIISGRNEKGSFFDYPIRSGTSVNLVLPKGKWTIAAIG